MTDPAHNPGNDPARLFQAPEARPDFSLSQQWRQEFLREILDACDAAARRKFHAQPGAGDTMPNGTIFAGICLDTGKLLYVAASDEPLRMSWDDAMKTARDSKAHGLRGWRLPTMVELDYLYYVRCAGALRGTFCSSACYWSSEDYSMEDHAYEKSFDDGWLALAPKLSFSSVRLVHE